MSVFRDVSIEWQGTTYQVQPSMRLLRQIESNGISITDIAHRTSRGSAPVSHISYVLSVLLTTAGARDASEEHVYAAIMTATETQSIALVTAVLAAFNPTQDDDGGKKPVARPNKRKAG